jgi:hypothetical protein
MVSRSEGYRRGAGKEQLAVAILQDFLLDKLEYSGEVITDPDDNYRHGDLRFPTGSTIECKGQPIDPVRYPQNFVEVFEVTRNDRHSGGLSQAASLLGLSLNELEDAKVRFRSSESRVGKLPRVSVSITSISYATATAYVNYLNDGRHLYFYRRDEILSHIRTAVRRGFVRGAGNSNEDTFAVFIPLARMRWVKVNQDWQSSGEDSEEDALAQLSNALL